MGKFALAIFLFGIIYSSFKIKDVCGVGNDFQSKSLAQNNKVDNPEYDTSFTNDNFRYYEKISEIKAINQHVRYQDSARDALLEFSADLRRSKGATHNVTNAFLKVIDEFEKEIAELYAVRRRRKSESGTIRELENFIKEAAKDRTTNAKILRSLTSQGLFLSQQKSDSSRIAKRAVSHLTLGARKFLKDIEAKIGVEAFESFLSINGKVTLIFVIDDTGSMSGDIGAAQTISENIIKSRENDSIDIDYILSPFNDPGAGPVTKKNSSQSLEFLKALKALRAHGGGDCAELAFEGMMNALQAGPQPGSSMYVFTDAPPKDATESNKNLVTDLAYLNGDIKINFFQRKNCGNTTAYQSYTDLASDTGGRVYELRSSYELKQLGEMVARDLRGQVTLGSKDWGWVASGRRKRALNIMYSILIDDSLKKVSIMVVVEYDRSGIKLYDPKGNEVLGGRVFLSKGVVYDIEKPSTGVYKLQISASSGKHKYKVDAVSGVNIDFGHYYVFIAERGYRVPIPLDQPLQGFDAKAFITIASAKSVKSNSLRIRVVEKRGTINAGLPLSPVGTSGARYFVKFKPPSGQFKLLLEGKTLKGSSFKRESSKLDQAVPVLLKLSHRGISNVLLRGRRTSFIVQILRGVTGPYVQPYKLSLKDDRGYGSVTLTPSPVYRARRGFARITFLVPTKAPAGKIENVKLSLIQSESPVATLLVSFLLV